MQNLSLTQFIDDFGDSLLNQVRKQNPPVFNGNISQKRALILDNLKRSPFDAQAKIIQAVTKLLLDEDERAAIINGDMGTGKTLMGIATAALLHHEGLARTMVLCPPHLVYKWRREILATIPDAKVVVLNGPVTLKMLINMRKEQKPLTPCFYIIGRVRLRLGHHWRPAYNIRKILTYDDTPYETRAVSCPDCAEVVYDKEGEPMSPEAFPDSRQLNCQKCQSPLWTLMRKKTTDADKALEKALCRLPTIGAKKAKTLIQNFSSDFLADCLADNVYQLVNLMDENGNLVFTDSQAKRMEKAIGNCEFGHGDYQASEFIKRYFPKGFFSFLIIDEGHEYKGSDSAQGQAMGVLASQASKILLLTGTLMGGYADDIFYILHRILPNQMLKDGFRYNNRGSLGTAAMQFLQEHGILKQIHTVKEGDNYRTSRGKRESVRTAKAPGFGPKGLARYILPYTAFLKLKDLDEKALPEYKEHFMEIAMNPQQADRV